MTLRWDSYPPLFTRQLLSPPLNFKENKPPKGGHTFSIIIFNGACGNSLHRFPSPVVRLRTDKEP